MGALLERLHHEHVERQRKWFAARHPPPRLAPEHQPPPPPAPGADLIELELYRLVLRAQKIELMLAAGEPIDELKSPQRPPCRLVQRIVAQFYRIAFADMVSHRRTAEFVRPRQVAMYLVQKFTRQSLPEIGGRFGRRDHTTVLHAVRKIERLRASDPRTRDELQLIIMRICAASGCEPFEETPGDG